MKCALCRDYLDEEHPSSIYSRNPKTFRLAWMHPYCYQASLENLKELPARSIDFDSRYDEYISRFQ